MLERYKNLRRCTIGAVDGDLGPLVDLYFDDVVWAVRYLVVDTGGWLSGRQVLISPAAAAEPDMQARVLPVSLTQEQVRQSPEVESALPIPRQHESELARYYGWPLYWESSIWVSPIPTTTLGHAGDGLQVAMQQERRRPPARESLEAHLRSASDLVGYAVQARENTIGHVKDFFADDWEWMIRYLVIDTGSFWPGKRVLIAPQAIHRIDWVEPTLSIELEPEKIRGAPEYDASVPVDRDYEERLHEYYGWSKYWL